MNFLSGLGDKLDDAVTNLTGNEQLGDMVGDAFGGLSGQFVPSIEQIIDALKDALKDGSQHAVQQANREGGFSDDTRIKISWPEEVSRVQDTLRSIGGEAKCDELVSVLNRSAEDASGGALQIFVDCIFNMSLDDAKGVLQGEGSAATDYMRDNTTGSLTEMMTPIVTNAMESFSVTMYWDDVIGLYNSIPLVPDIDFDLVRYVVEKALLGLFTLVADREREIRANPSAAADAMVQKVFKWKNQGCPEQ